MASEDEDGLALAITKYASGGALELAEVIARSLGGKPPDMNGAIQNYLLEEVPRLHGLLRAVDQSKCDAEEVLEIALQTVLNCQRTAKREKRRLMTNVAVNGFRADRRDPVRHRLFVRAVADLELEHVELLRAHEGGMSFEDPKEEGLALVSELASKGLMKSGPFGGSFKRVAGVQPPRQAYRITPMGIAFLGHLRDPEEE